MRASKRLYLGRSEGRQELCVKGGKKVIGKVEFYENCLLFCSDAAYGPALNLVVPYGLPAYRQSEKPLSALMLPVAYKNGKVVDKAETLLIESGVLALIKTYESEPDVNLPLDKVSFLTGHWSKVQDDASMRECLIVDDCLLKSDEQSRDYGGVVLLDLDFTCYASAQPVDDILKVFRDGAQGNEKLHFVGLSVNVDENALSTCFQVHAYLLVDLSEVNFYQKILQNSKQYYYEEFLSEKDDMEEAPMITCLGVYGNANVLGAFRWEELRTIEPSGENRCYSTACEDFRRRKRYLQEIERMGDTAWLVQRVTSPKEVVKCEVTSADVREAIVMGW